MKPFLIGSSNLKHHGKILGCPYVGATNVQRLMNSADYQKPRFLANLGSITKDSKVIVSLTNNSIHYDTHKLKWHCPKPKLVEGDELSSLNSLFNHNEFLKKKKNTEVCSIFDPERILTFESNLIEFFGHLKRRLVELEVEDLKDRIVILPTPPRHAYKCCNDASHKVVNRNASEFVVTSIYKRVIEKFNTEADCKFIRLDSNDKFIAHLLVTCDIDKLLTTRQKQWFNSKAKNKNFQNFYHNKLLHKILYKRILTKRDNYTHFRGPFIKVLTKYIRLTLSSDFNPIKKVKKKYLELHRDAKRGQ